MSKHSLLLVDGDTRSLRVLEVSLRKAGFTVTSATSVQDALDKLELGAPDLIISETTFPDGDGFELRRRVRAAPDWAEIPFVFLTAEAAIENKIRGLELGVDDYLTKPIYIKEIVARINILLQKRQRARFEERRDGRMRFAGRVADMPVVDVIQTIEISRKSGVIQFTGEHGRQGAIYFREGKVIDAEAGALQGEDAVYRLLTWSDGDFEVVFRTVRRRDAISTSSQGLLMEGMRRLDEWSRLLEQLPPLTHRFEIDTGELATRLGEVPDDNNPILRLIDGKRSLLEIIDSGDFGDLESLQAISRLYFEGLLLDLDHGLLPKKRVTGKSTALVVVEEPAVTLRSEEPRAVSPSMLIEEELVDPEPEPKLKPSPVAATPGPAAAVSDEPAAASSFDTLAAFSHEPGELMGGYRPSSLRLIEEAVMAAEAVEPGLFESSAPSAPEIVEIAQRMSREAAARALEVEDSTNSIPRTIEADEPPDDTSDEPDHEVDPASPEDLYPRREDSGLRMIGSLGRDRAEASGELVPLSLSAQSSSSIPTQRELVTILPRRITREIPVPILPPTTPPTTPPTATDEPAPRSPPPDATPLAVPPSRTAQTRAQTAGGTRRSEGPSPIAIALLLLAIALTVLAIYTRMKRTTPGAAPSHLDASVGSAPSVPPPANHKPTITPRALPSDAGITANLDAANPKLLEAMSPDAGTKAALDPSQKALELMTSARAALDANNTAAALDLANQSLHLHQTAKTYLLRAQIQQHLNKVDDALASVDAAIQLVPTSAPAWERRGRLLWTAHRYDEARPAFEKYLELDPKGEASAEFRRRLTEPKQ